MRRKHRFPSLATPGNITRNIVSVTMIPSLARPLQIASKQCVKVRAARAARLYSSFNQLDNCSFGVVLAVAARAARSVAHSFRVVCQHGYVKFKNLLCSATTSAYNGNFLSFYIFFKRPLVPIILL